MSVVSIESHYSIHILSHRIRIFPECFKCVPVTGDADVDHVIDKNKEQFGETIVPYRIYRESVSSSDSDTEYGKPLSDTSVSSETDETAYSLICRTEPDEHYFLSSDPNNYSGIITV